MRYIGSKSSSIEEIFKSVARYKTEGTFCDPFGGTSTVGAFFKQNGFKVFTGDLLFFAHYMQIAKLKFSDYPTFSSLKKELNIESIMDIKNYFNELPGTFGWFVENFALKRNFFSLENAAKIEASWEKIIKLKKTNILDENEFAYLISSLIESMDRVANTAGTYYAYLKNLSIKAARNYKFELIVPVKGTFFGDSKLGDALDLIKERHYDVIYLDPPYNDRRYHGYYHLPEAIARGIKPNVVGKAGVCKFQINIPSDFYGVDSAVKSLTNILQQAKYNLLLFHYCPNGLITEDNLDLIFDKYGLISKTNINSLGYSTKNTKRKSTTLLYTLRNE